MTRTRNSDNNAPATAVVGSSIAHGRAKKVPAKKKGRPTKATPLPHARQTEQVVQEQVPHPRPATIPAQVVMPPEMGKAFNTVKGAMEMFTTFMANQGQGGDQTPPPPGRRDGDHIQDTTAAAAMSMEAFASAVGFAKSLEGKKQNRRVERDQNKKAQTTSGFGGSIGGGNQGVPNKGSSVPSQSMPQTSGSFLGRHSQGNGIQSHQNQNFRTPVSQSRSSVGQPSNQRVTCSTCGKGIQVNAGAGYEVVTTVETLNT
ncbi:hypothetical protein HAX54_017322, partial [Datura stramonium]|nr:hypothetical protein [Datura stramonium]